MTVEWTNVTRQNPMQWRCWGCHAGVASDRGWGGTFVRRDGMQVQGGAGIRLCPHCGAPTFFLESVAQQTAPYGADVADVPDEIATLYAEARRAVAASPTLAAAGCRTILMRVAVDKGAPEGPSFMQYVDFLQQHGHVPAGAGGWLDEIRHFGNIAQHEIEPLERADAEDSIDFTAELLRAVYETPARGARAAARRANRGKSER